MPLTDKQIAAAKYRERPYKLPKERGLTVIVYPPSKRYPRGRKAFVHYVKINGKDTTFWYGLYGDITLADAREKRDTTRRLITKGVDPRAQKRAEKLAQADTFKAIAEEWLDAGCPGRRTKGQIKAETVKQYRHRLKTYVYPFHGTRPIRDIGTTEFHGTLKRLTSKGVLETAERVRSVSSRVFRYAIATGRAEVDPAGMLAEALPKAETQSFPAITDPTEIGGLLRAIDGYDGQASVVAALKLAPYVFVRPGELRAMQWSELDLDAAEWRIPSEKTKMGREHLVPLARQAVEILEWVRPITGKREYVFPGIRSPKRPISENTLNGALRRLGYTKEQMTAHGFRSMASTRLNELGFDPELIEVQLAHMDKDRIRAIYNRVNAESYFVRRRGMMQAWADYLDGLKAENGDKVVALHG